MPSRTPDRGAGAGTCPPVITAWSNATSATVCAIGPTVSREWAIGVTPSWLYRPIVGRSPAPPVSADGIRTEPPVSLPSPPGARRAPTAAPVPLGLPPATRGRAYGVHVPVGPA